MYKQLKNAILIFLVFCACQRVYGQECKKLFNSAMTAMCKGDTTSCLDLLDKYSNSCPKSKLRVSGLLLKGIIQEQNGNYEDAIHSLEKGLALYQNPENLGDIEDSCNWVIQTLNGDIVVSDYVLIIYTSSVYQKKSDFRTALYYLDKIDRNSITFNTGCVNGTIMLETSIAIEKANCYLGLRDTIAAINHLVEYCLFSEGPNSDKLISLLKELLQKKYTKQQISKEIEDSINMAKEIESISLDGFKSSKIEFIFFGVKIPFLYFSLSEFKKYISYNKNLLSLKL